MTNSGSQTVGTLLLLLVIASGTPSAEASDVITLISPNAEASSIFGFSVSGAGDINRDGSPDVVVGAAKEDPGTSPEDAGCAYVFDGTDGSLLFGLASPNEVEEGYFGYSVAVAGDVNQDGFADVIVGAIFENPGNSPRSAGRAYVFSGQNGALIYELASPNEETAGEFGWSVAGAGDVDQDGFADVIVGAPFEGLGGRAYVFSGHDGSVLLGLFSPNNESQGDFGYSVARVGDVNDDGSDDVVVGAPDEDPGGSPNGAGRAYVFSGGNGNLLLELMSPNEEYRGSLAERAPTSLGGFGEEVAGAGDVNGDKLADVIVGAWSESPGDSPSIAGRAYVFSGADGTLIFELVSPNEQHLGGFGKSVASAGDSDHDGFADVIVGASEAPPRAYVFSGRDGTVLFEHASPDGEQGGAFAQSVASAGDTNRDGFADVIVGAPGAVLGGRAYIFLSPSAYRVNSGGPNYTDTNGRLFVADRPYAPGNFGFVGGVERHFSEPIGGTDDDPLYQDVRVAREGDGDGIFAYRFDVPSPARYDVTLHLMAPALEGTGNVVMDVQAEGDVIFNDLDVTAEAGGEYQALVKTFAVDVNDGTLDLRFRAVNKAAVVSAIAVTAQTEARGSSVARRPSGGQR